MKYLIRYLALTTALGLLVFGCSDEPELLQAPPSGPLTSALNGTETLGDFAVTAGTGIVGKGVGMLGGNSGTISFGVSDVPAGVTVKEVILYWEGHHTTPNGDPDITVNGGPVTGTLIGGPTDFYESGGLTYRSSTYRAVLANVSLAGFGMAKNNGAGILVIYDDGVGTSTIGVRDGNDLAWAGFLPGDNRKVCVAQTFTFPAVPVARTAKIVLFASSVQTPRPNQLIVLIDGAPAPGYPVCPAFGDNANPEWDDYTATLTIPAGATSLTLQPVSIDCNASGLNPASLAWVCGSLSVPTPLAAIGDYVWVDENQNGCQDETGTGVNNVTVNLYQCNAPSTVYRTMKTGSGGLPKGEYFFDGLLPGDYFVEFTDLPVGFEVTLKDQSCSGGDAADSDADPTTGRTVCTTLDPAETDRTWDAGIFTTSEFGDTVWVDGDCDGCQDPGELGIGSVTVNLYRCSNPATVFLSTTTNSAGLYKFGNLAPGDYFVEFILPAGYVFTTPNACPQGDAKDSDADPATGRTACTTLTAGESDLSWDAGLVELLAIGDFVWYDDDRDGCQGPEEDGVPGVTVQLWNNGNVIATTTTNASGLYKFENLTPGTGYRVKFILPPALSDYVFTEKDACPAGDAKDSDAAPMTGMTASITLLCGQDDMTVDAGIFVPPIGCRMTGGGNDTFGSGGTTEVYTFGGQAGAPLASQPQPWGEWTHTQKRGPSGSFTFHAGTASAPPETEIDWIVCSDPGWCRQARPAPAKQLDFAGVGTFHNMKNVPSSISDYVVVGESLHWFEVNIDDLGEPGKAGNVDPPSPQCDPAGFGRNGGTPLADCGCPDFYRIRIYRGPTDQSTILYEVYGYIDGGNFQIHPPTGRDRKNLEEERGGRGK